MRAKHCTHLFGAAQLELTKPAPLLDPAKHLLDAAAGVDRLGVALMAGGPAINGGPTRAGGVLGHMRRDSNPAHLSDKPLRVAVLVGADRFPVGTGTISRHHLGSISLSGARRLCDAAVDDQGMAVVHEHVAPVAWQCWMGLGFPAQQRHSFGEDCVYGIRAATMGLVAELDASEISFRPLLPVLRLTKALARA